MRFVLGEARRDVDGAIPLGLTIGWAAALHAALPRQFDATDRRIDPLVYRLYGLSDEEIRIVEEATAR